MERWISGVMMALCLAVPAAAEPEGRVRVIDGDTVEIGGVRVRLFGIDAPELDQSCTSTSGRSWACGRWSRDKVSARYSGRRATCEDLGTDRYGRVIGRCYVGGQDMAADIVRAGLAQAYRRYSRDYLDAEKEAVVAGRGIFGGSMTAPAEHRRSEPPADAATAGCAIKGNVSSSGRIYHLPGQEHYARTRINPSRGERWFCSEAEARAAGWRRARR